MTKPYIPRNPVKHAKWLKEPVAIIERPLRLIKSKSTEIRVNEAGQQETFISPVYFMAQDFAKAGDGYAVKKIAAMVMNG